MSAGDVALLSCLIFLLSLVSRRILTTPLTAPMLALGAGLLFGGAGLNWLSLGFAQPVLHLLAEFTLVLVLFGDATRIDLAALRREPGLPFRLLGIGLPLTMALGGLVGYFLIPQLSFWEAMTLGAVLAPTDAALGQAVVVSRVVPVKIRQALNVESGLNDGIALPFVLLFASLASMATGHERSGLGWVQFAAMQLLFGPLAGFCVARAGGWLVDRGIASGAVAQNLLRVSGLVLPLICYSGAELLHGNGFLAAFVGGMTFGAAQRGRCKPMLQFLEAEGELLMLLVFFGLGASLLGPALAAAAHGITGVRLLTYALLSLTVVRMLPVAISLLGAKLRRSTNVFLGWFGPRGLASLLYVILILSTYELPHKELLLHSVVITCALSVLLHGLSAAPGAARYGRLTADPARNPGEHEDVFQHVVRGPEGEPPKAQ